MKWLIMVMPLFLTGCLNITSSIQPEDVSVAELRESSDCVPIVFGLAYGSATLEGALKQKVKTLDGYDAPWKTIAKVRRVQLHDYQFLFLGARCVEVMGE